ncbi:kanadaptin [Microplitis mediator]|uniref:kanadaptin n=1 Tax=Microplitis mediator TaxID=375433 RepID=UPI002554D727|nr:kanadaptin [Microplitis mediator]
MTIMEVNSDEIKKSDNPDKISEEMEADKVIPSDSNQDSKSAESESNTVPMSVDESKPDHVSETEDHSELNQDRNLDESKVDPEVSKSTDELPGQEAFKKPALLIGPRRGKTGSIRILSNGKVSHVAPVAVQSTSDSSDEPEIISESIEPPKLSSQDHKQQLPLPYKEPAWGGSPSGDYKVEVLKSGVILDTIDLTKKSFHVIGRLPVCDIPLAHPTISRYHAILQYRVNGDEKNGPGFYLYDLESTHGTFWNGCRIRPKTYVKLQGGHMLRFGCSQRKFIVQTPVEEEEQESEYTVTQLKEMRRQELMEREKEERERQQMFEEMERLRKEKEEAEGIDWGMGEDADEETDMTENPYAMTNNEELFLDDPKKTLRGWFEREGFDLQYQTEERGIGQFICWVDLPIEPAVGRNVRAEALVKGKKKESVIQCAIEACRVLDRYGLLRQATHEGRKRKSRNWEEEDFYDSDEDNYLDRTGTVERKREQRMRNAGKLETKAETYATLVEKLSGVTKEIKEIEVKLKKHQDTKRGVDSDSNEDALDAFMSNLSSAVLNKSDILKMKSQLQQLKKEEENLKKLVDFAKPANLPSLVSSSAVEDQTEKPEKEKRRRTDDDDGLVCKLVEDEERKVSKSRYGLIKSEEIAVIQKELKQGDEVDEQESVEGKKTEENEGFEGKIEQEGSKKTEKKNEELSEAELLKRKKKNMKRTQKRAEKAAKESKKSYDEDIHSVDYSTWVPPSNQSGDGRTSLNDKFGY